MRAFGRGIFGRFCALSSLVMVYVVASSEFTDLRGLLGDWSAEANTNNNGGLLVQRQESNTKVTPIVASVSQYWEGNDGPWSSFAIQVGNRPQNVRVLPSTASTSTWVVYDQGCPADAPSTCRDSRGGIFNPNNSLTWVPNSIFDLGIDTNLDYKVFGDFAFDTVTLGWQGSGGPTVEHTVIAGIGDTTFTWLGALGLNPRPTNFSTFPNNPQVSFVQALRNENRIPSISWAYTAGAQYRLNKVFGSLVFGGYDTSRFTIPSETSPDLTFPFYTDVARDLLVGISSVETSNTTSSTSSVRLLDDGIFAFIDSTIPHLWLPETVCKAFESAFGLTWNSTTELYTLNSSQLSTLTELNPTIKFEISPEIPSSPDRSVTISFPFSAFKLNSSWPHTDDSIYYFPLKRAANDTQYTLGRAFLQEAYVIADYERGNFSVWPCSWNSEINQARIVAIQSVNDAETDSIGSSRSTGNSGLSTGAIAGIAAGAAIFTIAIIATVYLCFRKHRRSRRPSLEFNANSTTLGPLTPAEICHSQINTTPRELDSHTCAELSVHYKIGVVEAPDCAAKLEMEDTGAPAELLGTEKRGSIAVYEMDANEQVSQSNPGRCATSRDAEEERKWRYGHDGN